MNYEWHDLKKNPTDVPPNTGYEMLLVKFEWGGYMTTTYNDGFNRMPQSERKGWTDVIAWKFIEPFEPIEE